MERLSSQYASSDYNKARRSSMSVGMKAPTPINFRHSVLPPPTSRSSFTSIIVESPPHPTPGPLGVMQSRSQTPVSEESEGQITPTAKRRYIAGPGDAAGRGLIASDTGAVPMQEEYFPVTPLLTTELPPNTKTSQTHPLNLSAIVPPEMLWLFGYHLLGAPPDEQRSASPVHFAPSSPPRRGVVRPRLSSQTSSLRSSPVPREPRAVRPVAEPYHLLQHPRHVGHGPLDLWYMTKPPIGAGPLDPWTMPLANPTLPLAAVQQPPLDGGPGPIGNLLLSSCPGKKVRLSATTSRERRSAIYRDLRLDLQRIKENGVRAIVCCLDNDELALLGAPWPEYYQLTQELDLPVYRLPMTEGQGPVGGSSVLDAALEVVLAKHTLRGESVLVHCRGGVGRAGLVACAWMLKMHLISGMTLAPFSLVERVVEVVRRRRSIKCIETPAQVKQLLDYVRYLDSMTKGVRAEEVLAAH